MQLALLTALGVGGATIIGALIGFLFKNISHKFSDIVFSFAAGVMLSAAIVGLIIPSLDRGGKFGIIVTIAGIFAGAVFLALIDRIVPHLHKMAGVDIEAHNNKDIGKVFLFIIAIAIHNFPEGIAAGVGFGSNNTSQALVIALGIALQNIPEGMIVIGPMLAAGVSKKRTLLIASMTGVIEVAGTLIGYFGTYVSEAVLPFALSFAGGTMLYIVSDEMIPETHSHGNEKGATYSLLVGFSLMLLVDTLLG